MGGTYQPKEGLTIEVLGEDEDTRRYMCRVKVNGITEGHITLSPLLMTWAFESAPTELEFLEFRSLFRVRTANILGMHGIKTLRDLARYSERELAALPEVGRKVREEVKKVLDDHGMSLRWHDSGHDSPS